MDNDILPSRDRGDLTSLGNLGERKEIKASSRLQEPGSRKKGRGKWNIYRWVWKIIWKV
jgi:hypothetical protein